MCDVAVLGDNQLVTVLKVVLFLITTRHESKVLMKCSPYCPSNTVICKSFCHFERDRRIGKCATKCLCSI